MAKISINCGQCKTKLCNIKKDFRELALKYKEQYVYQTFNLKCPYKTHKYQKDDKVLITVGVGRHLVEFKHDCNYNEGYHDEDDSCSYCKFKDKCDGGEVTHINIKYKEYIEINAIIDGYFKSDKYVYSFDLKQLEGKLNDLDTEFFDSMNETFNATGNFFSIPEDFMNVSKSKFIKKI